MKAMYGLMAEHAENGFSGQAMFLFRRGMGIVRKKLYFKLDLNEAGPDESYLKIYNERGQEVKDREVWQIVFDMLFDTVNRTGDARKRNIFIDMADENELKPVRHVR